MAEIITNQMTKTRISGVRFVDEDAPKMTRYSLADKMAENEPKLEYHVKTITVDDKPKVLSFLRRFFFRDEPLNYSIRLIPDGEDSTCIELEEYSMSCVEENLCLMAVSPAGAVVGVMLSGVTEKIEDGDEPSYIKLCTSPKFQKIQRLLYRVEKDVDLLNKYPNKKCVDVKIISVDSNWRGKGIAGTMLEKTIDMCKGLGYDLLRTDCSSHFTAKLCKSFGFEKIYELKYSDYLDENGKPVFIPEQPHNAMTTWIKML